MMALERTEGRVGKENMHVPTAPVRKHTHTYDSPTLRFNESLEVG